MMDLETRLAIAMRAAYNDFDDPGSKVIPWDRASKQKQEAWRVCARAAIEEMNKQ